MAFVDATFASSATTSVAVAAPAGIADGDILVALCFTWAAAGGATITLPTGFTEWYEVAAQNYQCALGWKRASSESGSYTFLGASAAEMGASIAAYRGRIATGDPRDVGSATVYTAATTVVRAAGVTIATTGSDLIWAGFVYNANPTEPAGFTVREEGTTADATWLLICDLLNQGTGATGDKDASIASAETSKHAFLLALKPAAAPSTSAGAASLAGVGSLAATSIRYMVEGHTVPISWTESTDYDSDYPISYEAEFSALGDFTDAVSIFSGVQALTTNWTLATNLVGANTATCRIRIRARDTANELSSWDVSTVFGVINAKNGAASLTGTGDLTATGLGGGGVVGASLAGVGDLTAGGFAAPVITVTSPSGGEIWAATTIHPVTWTAVPGAVSGKYVVWVLRAGLYFEKMTVAADGSASYSTPWTVDVGVNTGYTLGVRYHSDATTSIYISSDWGLPFEVTVQPRVALAGVGDLTAAGMRERFGHASLTGVGDLTATGWTVPTTWFGSAALTGVGDVAATGGLTRPGSASLAGVGDLTVNGTRIGRFGTYTTSGGSAALNSDQKLVSRYQAPYTGTITGITMRLIGKSITPGTAYFKGVIYSDVSTDPSALLATGSEIVIAHTAPDAERVSTFGTPLAVAAGTYYHLGEICGGTLSGMLFLQYAAGDSHYNADTYSDGASNPFGFKYAETAVLHLYATYAPQHFAAVTLAGTGTLSAAGDNYLGGSASLAGVGGLTAAGIATKYGHALLAGVGTLAVTPTVTVVAPDGTEVWGYGSEQTLSWTISMAVSTGEFQVFAVDSDANWVATVGAVAAVAGQTTYEIPWTVVAPPRTDYQLWVAFSTDTGAWGTEPWGEFTWGGSFPAWDLSNADFTITAQAALTGVGTIGATGYNQSKYGSVSLTGVGDLAATGRDLNKYGASSLAGVGDLTVAGVCTKLGVASLAGAGTLSARGAQLHEKYGYCSLHGIGYLSCGRVVAHTGLHSRGGRGLRSGGGRGLVSAGGRGRNSAKGH